MNYGIKLFKLITRKNIPLNPVREYAFKSDLKIKWVRPVKIPCYKPEQSGDLGTFPEIDKTQIQEDFKHCKELETADETVRKLFSLEFAPKRATTRKYMNEMIHKVQRHKNDFGSHEVRIAKWTGVIRAMQETMERFPRNKRFKVQLKELIDRRKKFMRYLRKWDYKRFEWILETLELKYKPMPLDVHWITRKDSLRKLTDKHCEDLRQNKLDRLKLQLQAEQPEFLEEKIRILQFIQEEQKECGVQVTISDEEIEGVKKQLEDLKLRNKNVNEDE